MHGQPTEPEKEKEIEELLAKVKPIYDVLITAGTEL